ncbi:MAG: hypothetical protein ACJARE_001184 [Paracoccaceae bacterium]|jgi:hypothetical protein
MPRSDNEDYLMALTAKGAKAKGDACGRELAAWVDTRFAAEGRAFQGAGEADILGTPHLHVGAKRVQRLRLRDAMAQTKRSTKAPKDTSMPVVVLRQSRMATDQPFAIARLADFWTLYEAYLQQQGFMRERVPDAGPVTAQALPPLRGGAHR